MLQRKMFFVLSRAWDKEKKFWVPWGKTSFSFSLPSLKLTISLILFGKMLYTRNFQGILLCLKGEVNQVSGNQTENSKDSYYPIWTVGCFKLWQQVWQVGEACVSEWGEIRPLVCTILWLFFFFTCLLNSLIILCQFSTSRCFEKPWHDGIFSGKNLCTFASAIFIITMVKCRLYEGPPFWLSLLHGWK